MQFISGGGRCPTISLHDVHLWLCSLIAKGADCYVCHVSSSTLTVIVSSSCLVQLAKHNVDARWTCSTFNLLCCFFQPPALETRNPLKPATCDSSLDLWVKFCWPGAWLWSLGELGGSEDGFLKSLVLM